MRYLSLTLCGSILACQSRPISVDESSDTNNMTSDDTTSFESSSESVAESESGVEDETESSMGTETETDTDTDMDPPCAWEPAPPSECIPTDVPTPPFDPSGFKLFDASPPALEIGPDGSVHVVAALAGQDDDDNGASYFVYQTNASGMWTVERFQGGPAADTELPSAISPSGVLHVARGTHLRGTNGTFLSSNPDDGSHNVHKIAWSRNGDYGYMYGLNYELGGRDPVRAIWSSDGDCMTLEWIRPSCGYHIRGLAVDAEDRLHVLESSFEEKGFALSTLDGDALWTTTTWMNGLFSDTSGFFGMRDFVIDSSGVMHTCYEIEEQQNPASVRYARFTEFGDWEEFPIPELNPAESEFLGSHTCSLAVNDDGSVVWMTASTAIDRVARIENGVASIIPIVIPFEGDIQLSAIALDEIDQPVLAGRCWADVIDTYFVMRPVAGVWQLEHSFTI